jgi:AcrR family transcriptional regulator
MSPLRPDSGRHPTRERIVERAVSLASAGGFDAVTLGRLASDVEMSKAGVIGHFGTMECLQLAAVERAIDIFRREVWERASDRKPGLDRLLAIGDAWIAYVAGSHYVGGCLTSGELSASANVREAVADALRLWRRVLRAEAQTALDAGELAPGIAPDDVAFELGALALATAQAVRLDLDGQAVERARRSTRRHLGLSLNTSGEEPDAKP